MHIKLGDFCVEYFFSLNNYLFLTRILDAGDTIWCVAKNKDPQVFCML